MNNSANLAYQDLIIKTLHGEDVLTRNSWVKRYVHATYTFTQTPLVSLRKTAWKNALREMAWFLSGSNNINDLHPSVHSWWQPWADKDGRVANNYSVQFRAAYGRDGQPYDQIAGLIDALKNHPNSRRTVITTWNSADMASKATPITNCHNTMTQFFVHNASPPDPAVGDQSKSTVFATYYGRKDEPSTTLDMVTYQRSNDVICGLPHNWIQSWAFLLYLARRTGHKVGRMVWTGGDNHVYRPHVPLAQKIAWNLKAKNCSSPELVYTPTGDDFKADDFTLDGTYDPLLTDKAEMVV